MVLCTFLHVCNFYLVQCDGVVSTEPIQVTVKLRDRQREREREREREVGKKKSDRTGTNAPGSQRENPFSPETRTEQETGEETRGLGNKE